MSPIILNENRVAAPADSNAAPFLIDYPHWLPVAEASALLKSQLHIYGSHGAVDEKQIARRYYISGTVQGVGYRYFALRTARGLGVAGYSRNLSDGRVEVYAVGPDASHAALRMELARGPRAAEVSSVVEEAAAIEVQFAQSFSIEYDA